MAESISKEELKQASDQYVILDVREPDEVVNGSIENSQNMPLGLYVMMKGFTLFLPPAPI